MDEVRISRARFEALIQAERDLTQARRLYDSFQEGDGDMPWEIVEAIGIVIGASVKGASEA